MEAILPRKYRSMANGYQVRCGKGGQYFYEHRDVWEAANGPIPEGHHIHHKNEDKSDNRLENLECLPSKVHRRLHSNSPESLAKLAAVRDDAPERTLDCWACDKVFTTKSQLPVVKFCGRECSRKYNNWVNDAGKAARRAALRTELNCPYCGTKFMPWSKMQKYCTPTCTEALKAWERPMRNVEQPIRLKLAEA